MDRWKRMLLSDLPRILGLRSAVPKAGLLDLTQQCVNLTDRHGDILPDYFRRSIPTMAGWWSIPLYVRFSAVTGAQTLRYHDWQAASRMVADAMMARLFPEMPRRWRETRNLRDALQGQVFGVSRLWSAAFGFPPDQATLTDTEQMTERLTDMILDDALGLRATFNLPSDDDLAMDEREGDKAEDDEIAEFCRAYATFFGLCARSQQ